MEQKRMGKKKIEEVEEKIKQRRRKMEATRRKKY